MEGANYILILFLTDNYTTHHYKILSLTYKSLQYNKPSSISDLLTIQPTRSTRSSAVVTLQRSSSPSRLKISDRSFYFQAPTLWNALPHHHCSHSHSSQSHILFSHYLLLNSTSNWKPTFFFIPILLSPSLSLLDWPLGTLIRPVYVIHNPIHHRDAMIINGAKSGLSQGGIFEKGQI